MIILIIGEPDSGKSQKAESIAIELSGDGKRIYIATMIPYGDEGIKRIEKHRKMREGKEFITIEKATDVGELAEEIGNISKVTCLLECMSNLVGNEMHLPEKTNMEDSFLANKIIEDIRQLSDKSENLVIVSNRFPLNDSSYDEDTIRYVRLTELINNRLSEIADKVYELSNADS